VFVTAADKSFWTATAFLLGTLLLVSFVMRRDRVSAEPGVLESDAAAVPALAD
jgi:hypothetical protein